jgi:hypothetical protein
MLYYPVAMAMYLDVPLSPISKVWTITEMIATVTHSAVCSTKAMELTASSELAKNRAISFRRRYQMIFSNRHLHDCNHFTGYQSN